MSNSEHNLPWRACEPDVDRHGSAKQAQYVVRDANGNLVCVCYSRRAMDPEGEEHGAAQAYTICDAMNRTMPKVCVHCGKPATCFGWGEEPSMPTYNCNDCCGHGNEDGHCEQIGDNS